MIRKIFRQNRIICFSLILISGLVLFFYYQNRNAFSAEEEILIIEEANLRCKIVSFGTEMQRMLDFQQFLLERLTIIKEEGENTVSNGEFLVDMASDCRSDAGRCLSYSWKSSTPGFCDCTVPPKQGCKCAGYCSGNPCPEGIEDAKDEVLASQKKVAKAWKDLNEIVIKEETIYDPYLGTITQEITQKRELEKEIDRFREEFLEIENLLGNWYENRGEESIYDCYTAKAMGIVKNCPDQNDYYICKPIREGEDTILE